MLVALEGPLSFLVYVYLRFLEEFHSTSHKGPARSSALVSSSGKEKTAPAAFQHLEAQELRLGTLAFQRIEKYPRGH